MDPQKQKEEFQYAYVCALAAHAGLNRGDFRVDDDSIDITFQAKGDFGPGRRRSPMIQVQLKCSSQDLIADDVIKFPLKVKNYNDLRGDEVVVPRYLAVLLVPDDLEQWIAHHDDHIALFKSCHWLSAYASAYSHRPAKKNPGTASRPGVFLWPAQRPV